MTGSYVYQLSSAETAHLYLNWVTLDCRPFSEIPKTNEDRLRPQPFFNLPAPGCCWADSPVPSLTGRRGSPPAPSRVFPADVLILNNRQPTIFYLCRDLFQIESCADAGDVNTTSASLLGLSYKEKEEQTQSSITSLHTWSGLHHLLKHWIKQTRTFSVFAERIGSIFLLWKKKKGWNSDIIFC